ncbi:uncharacterized protein LOC133805521 [Humulus lupulus]|uniref:uncharacterized protein LOC133805521 n=1 Tax=Humulus lupulus TaxID=3486 RepID=UPI002B40831E|nr:uncharacterized protein LOC133805521 [Humulus lupulus]
MSVMGSTLDFKRVEGNDRVAYATYMLRDDARIWWEVISQARDVTTMTWAEFQQAFNDKYYNVATQASKVDDFATLTQGNKTVTEYALKFDRLTKFAADLVLTNATRVDQFIRGLKRMIARDMEIVSIGGNCTYAHVLESALTTERMENRIWKEGAAKREARKNASQGHNSNDQKRKGSDQAGQSSQEKRAKDNKGNNRTGNREWVRYPECNKCKKRHQGEYRANACYGCGKEGHNKRNCPQKNQEGFKDQHRKDVIWFQHVCSLSPSLGQKQAFAWSQGFKTMLPNGEVVISKKWFRPLPLRVDGRELFVDLIELDITDFDVIFEMDRLTKYNATIDCKKKMVVFKLDKE